MAKSSSETVRNNIGVLGDLLRPSGGEVPYKRLSRELSKMAGKEPEWSRRYILSVHNGTVSPSERLSKAIMDLGAYYDGMGLMSGAKEVKVWSKDENISQSYVMGKVKVCLKCGLRFVPNVPWRLYCGECL